MNPVITMGLQLALVAVSQTGVQRAATTTPLPPEVVRCNGWINYPRNVIDAPSYCASPTSTESVARIVTWASNNKLRVRPVAAGHSWSRVTAIDPGNVVLSTLKLAKIAIKNSPDGNHPVVVAQAGARLISITRAMAPKLAFANLGEMQWQTIGGAISTNTHGTGVGKTGFAGVVESLVLVDGRGNIHRDVSRQNEPDLFRAALGGVGLVGIITEVTVRVVRAFNIEVHCKVMDLADLVRTEDGGTTTEMQQLISKTEWFQFLYLVGTTKVIAQYGDRTTEDSEPKSHLGQFIDQNLYRLATYAAAHLRRFAAKHMISWVRDLQRLGDKPKVLTNSEAFTSSIRPPKIWAWSRESEFFIPRRYTEAAIARLNEKFQEMSQAGEYPGSPIVGARFVKGDDSFLSPTYIDGQNDEFVAIEVYDTEGQTFGFLEKAQEVLEQLVGHDKLRAHLGKLSTDTPESFRTRYKHWDEFARVRKAMDPEGLLLNEWSAPLFGDRKVGER